MRRQGECPICPPWVLRCAHFEGRIVMLDDYAVDAPHVCGGEFTDHNLRFRVLIGTYSPCYPARGCDVPVQDSDGDDFTTDSLPAAEEEFDRRAAVLRPAPVEA